MKAPAFILGYHGCDREVGEAVLAGELDPGNCLDLLGADSIRLVEQAHRAMHDELNAEHRPLPVNRRAGTDYPLRYLDCAVINFLHQDIQEAGLPRFDSVRAAFVEGAPIYKGRAFTATRTRRFACAVVRASSAASE